MKIFSEGWITSPEYTTVKSADGNSYFTFYASPADIIAAIEYQGISNIGDWSCPYEEIAVCVKVDKNAH